MSLETKKSKKVVSESDETGSSLSLSSKSKKLKNELPVDENETTTTTTRSNKKSIEEEEEELNKKNEKKKSGKCFLLAANDVQDEKKIETDNNTKTDRLKIDPKCEEEKTPSTKMTLDVGKEKGFFSFFCL